MGNMIAALYVDAKGPYVGRGDIDAYTIDRDARTYGGPYAVIAHPPCARWGSYWFGGPTIEVRKEKGDDGGLFEHALSMVRQYGGVLEHPANSYAWEKFGIVKPPHTGGWVSAGMFDGGWTCCVEQGHYGHKARKATWLYAVGVSDLPGLKWGESDATAKIDDGFPTREARQAAKRWDEKLQRWRVKNRCKQLSKKERRVTPPQFADILIEIANGVKK